MLLEVLADDARRDLLRLENLGEGEISSGPIARAVETLKIKAEETSGPLASGSFGNLHVVFSRLSIEFGKQADLDGFTREWLSWLEAHPNQRERCLALAIADFIAEKNPLGF